MFVDAGIVRGGNRRTCCVHTFARLVGMVGWLVRDGCIAVDMESQHWSSVGTKTFRTVGCFAGVLRRRKALPVWQR